jgi:hypothetical protein
VDIICATSGKRFSSSDQVAECKKTCEDGKPCPYVKSYEPKTPRTPIGEQPQKPMIIEDPLPFEPIPHKSSIFGMVMFAIVLILVGLAFLFGFTRYWPLILVVIGLAVLARMLYKNFNKRE